MYQKTVKNYIQLIAKICYRNYDEHNKQFG